MAVRRVVPNITSDHFEESAAFYMDLLGFEVGMELEWVTTFVSPSNRSAQVTISRKDPSASEQPQLSIEVDDVDAVHADSVRRGVEIVYPLTDEVWGVRRFFVRDPNGVVVNVLSHS